MNKIAFIIYVFSSVGGLICFKFGAKQELFVAANNFSFEFKISWVALLGLCLYILSFFIYMGLVSKSNLTYLVPISTVVVNILIILSSIFIFKEHIRYVQSVGIAFILIGAFLINYAD